MNAPRRRAPALDLTGLHPDTVAVAAGRPHLAGQPVNTPMVPVSNYDSGNGPEYARGDGTDTWRALEDAVGALEGGKALAFSSGWRPSRPSSTRSDPAPRSCCPTTAIRARPPWWPTVLRVSAGASSASLPPKPNAGCRRPPGPTSSGWRRPATPCSRSATSPRCAPPPKRPAPWLRSTTPVATPLLQRPLDLGATFSVHSATKFIGGHSDLLAGIVVCADRQPGWDGFESLTRRRTYGGATPGTLESYLALRGLRTLSLRLERAQANAVELAERLDQHRLVTKVRYPGLLSHPGHDLARATLDGPGALLSFELVGSAVSTDVRLSKLQLIHRATSLGAVETCIERRAKLSGQDHLPPTLCRLSVGIEHVEDLWSDLVQAIDGLVD
ncbi:MAG: PLP-dependent transferase [Acidimicrobiales bacterium]